MVRNEKFSNADKVVVPSKERLRNHNRFLGGEQLESGREGETPNFNFSHISHFANKKKRKNFIFLFIFLE